MIIQRDHDEHSPELVIFGDDSMGITFEVYCHISREQEKELFSRVNDIIRNQ